jgi:hypothetical protein
MAAKKNSVFEVTEDFLSGTESSQDKAVRAFIAANPKAVVVPNEVGQMASLSASIRAVMPGRFWRSREKTVAVREISPRI